ncbi:MAG: hypothetical protein HYU41_17045 [Candidatus Rokubacteria bacterium]|nr:hypothetical protein [Candidatus Rokubacteria bacterium]
MTVYGHAPFATPLHPRRAIDRVFPPASLRARHVARRTPNVYLVESNLWPSSISGRPGFMSCGTPTVT